MDRQSERERAARAREAREDFASRTFPMGLSSHSKLRFDPTINLGHVLTFTSTMLAVLVGGFSFWTSMDKRIVVLEEARSYQSSRDQVQDSAVGGQLNDIKDTLKDLRTGIDRLNRAQADRATSKP